MALLSIDVGSSRCKAAVFSHSGEMLALRSSAWLLQYPQPGRAELNPEIFLEVVTGLVREIASLPLADGIEAICISSHGETLIPIGANGRPLRSAILNTDGRASREAAWCEEQIGRERLFSITGHTVHPMYPIPKLLWLRENEPEVFRSARWFFGVADYLLFRLNLPPLMDYSHAARFMALDVGSRVWSQEVLGFAQVHRDSLATPVQAGTIAGKLDRGAAELLGLKEGTPVVVGGHDQVVGALGLGVIDSGRASGSLGTYECVLVVSDRPLLNPAALQGGLNSYPHAAPGKFATIAYFPSGMMLEWLGNLLSESKTEHDLEPEWKILESQAPGTPTGLLAMPHLIGSCNPEFDPRALGAIYGLSRDSSRSHLYQGVLEGIACELALIVGCLESAGSRFDHMNVFGGGTRSALGMRLRAAITRKYLHILRCQESVCLGGAMLSSVALNIHRDLESAAKEMVHEERCIEPDLNLAGEYADQFASYFRFRSLLMQSNPFAQIP